MTQVTQFLGSLLADPTVDAVALAVLGAVVGVWLAAAWWTYADISRRSGSELARLLSAGWVLVSTPALLPLSLGAYLLARPQQTVAERRAQRLFEAIAPSLDDGLCPACARPVDAAWRRCPACTIWLASGCATCNQWSAADLDLCPFCAHDKATPSTSELAMARGATAIVPESDVVASSAPATASGLTSFVSAVALADRLAFAGDVELARLVDADGNGLPAPSMEAGPEAPTARVRLERPRPGGIRAGSPAPRRLVGNRGARVRRTEGAERSAGSRSVGAGS